MIDLHTEFNKFVGGLDGDNFPQILPPEKSLDISHFSPEVQRVFSDWGRAQIDVQSDNCEAIEPSHPESEDWMADPEIGRAHV